jgi:AraC-like DNA-binding protein
MSPPRTLSTLSSPAAGTAAPRQAGVTISVAFAHSALSRLPVGHPAREQVLAAAGVSERVLATPDARIPAEQFAALWLGAVKVLDDEFFGLDSRQMRGGSFALLCRSLMSARTLGQAMNRFLRGFELFLVDVRGELLSDGTAARVVVHSTHDTKEAARIAQELFITVVHGVLCWLAGQRVPLRHADFNYAPPDHADEYPVVFSRSVAFDADVTTLVFDAAWLGQRIMQDEAALKQFLASSPLLLLVKYRRPDRWASRVRHILLATEPAHWPSLKSVAATLGTTATTLARRLADEGTRYQQIKDALRRDRAVSMLRNGTRSIDEIAVELGYEDPRAFYRSFRRWTGCAPGAFRQAAANGPTARAPVSPPPLPRRSAS